MNYRHPRACPKETKDSLGGYGGLNRGNSERKPNYSSMFSTITGAQYQNSEG